MEIEITEEQQELFELEKTTEAHGKSLDALAHSRERRTEIMRLFDGDLPMSIMKAKIYARQSDLSTGTYKNCGWATSDQKKAQELGSHALESFSVSGQSVRLGRLSQFPQNIGRMVVRLYTKAGDMIVDPFAGHNSRMELVINEARHYHGYDISHRFMQFNRELAELLQKETELKIELHEHSSREMIHTPDEYGDFTLTSPPYYDIEDYGDEEEQLGKAATYEIFLDQITDTIRENYRVLKKGAYCIWFINDFRRKGRFHSYHVDLINRFNAVGFTQQDLLVVDLGYPIKAAFATQIVDQRILPKRHEYGIIFQKL